MFRLDIYKIFTLIASVLVTSVSQANLDKSVRLVGVADVADSQGNNKCVTYLRFNQKGKLIDIRGSGPVQFSWRRGFSGSGPHIDREEVITMMQAKPVSTSSANCLTDLECFRSRKIVIDHDETMKVVAGSRREVFRGEFKDGALSLSMYTWTRRTEGLPFYYYTRELSLTCRIPKDQLGR